MRATRWDMDLSPGGLKVPLSAMIFPFLSHIPSRHTEAWQETAGFRIETG
jgi:hypothetical protein